MSNTSSAKKYGWVLSAAIMLVLSFAVAYFSKSAYAAEIGKFDAPVEISFTIESTEDVDISGTTAADYSVRAVKKALDGDGNLVAYVVESTVTGYNKEKEIVVASTITADGMTLAGIKVLEQDETEYLGDRISTAEFTDRFTGRYLPVVLTGSSGRGAHVDALSKSTISSAAVLLAVNNAHDFVNAEFINEN